MHRKSLVGTGYVPSAVMHHWAVTHKTPLAFTPVCGWNAEQVLQVKKMKPDYEQLMALGSALQDPDALGALLKGERRITILRAVAGNPNTPLDTLLGTPAVQKSRDAGLRTLVVVRAMIETGTALADLDAEGGPLCEFDGGAGVASVGSGLLTHWYADPIVASMFAAEFGGDIGKWDTAVTLLDDWQGTLTDLIDTVHSLAE